MNRVNLACLALAAAFALPAHAAGVAPSIEFHDGKITPVKIEVPANTRFKITVHNTGKTA